MRWEEYINPDEVRRAVAVLQEPGSVFECRILGTSKKDQLSGYFKDADTMLREFDKVDLRSRNVYVTIGKVKEECFARAQHEHFIKGAASSSDEDMAGYRWLFIDLDPIRRTGISSTAAELKKAEELARKVYLYLKNLGFEEPVKALSGNGCHLLYRISLLNTKENNALVGKCLKVLAALFDTSAVQVDTTNYNPSRICKLHGTLAQKGTSTEERPHRMSRIFSVPEEIKITGKAFLEKLVSELPEEPEPDRRQTRSNQSTPAEFDLIGFMSQHGITYEEDSNDRAKIFRLDECPFDHSHRNGDSKIFLYHNGAIAFKCHHNSCRDKRWQDVRKLFDPTAYDRDWQRDDSRIDSGWQEHNRNKKPGEIVYTELMETEDHPMLRNARMISEDPEPDHEYIRSGITEVDRVLRGLEKTGVTVISGTRASGKSTLIGQIINNTVNDGHTVVCYSGELNNKSYLRWLMRQAAGKNNIASTDGRYRLKPGVEEKILDWYGDRFWLYDNRFGNRFDRIEHYLRSKLKEHKADLCIIDNLMALDLKAYDSRDKYEAQTQFVWALKNLAQLTNTHIIFVAHPKKANGFLRLDDISGSGNITNIVDNALIVHRRNRDFENGFKDTFKVSAEKEGIDPSATNVIEIAKDREYGTQDLFISLFYEESTKRLRNSKSEFVRYSWEPEEPEFVPVDDDDFIPF